MNFSDKLKKLRNDKKITQSELADAIYVSRIAGFIFETIYETKIYDVLKINI